MSGGTAPGCSLTERKPKKMDTTCNNERNVQQGLQLLHNGLNHEAQMAHGGGGDEDV